MASDQKIHDENQTEKRFASILLFYVHVIGRPSDQRGKHKYKRNQTQTTWVVFFFLNHIQNKGCTFNPFWKVIRNRKVGSIDQKVARNSLKYLQQYILEWLLSFQAWHWFYTFIYEELGISCRVFLSYIFTVWGSQVAWGLCDGSYWFFTA